MSGRMQRAHDQTNTGKSPQMPTNGEQVVSKLSDGPVMASNKRRKGEGKGEDKGEIVSLPLQRRGRMKQGQNNTQSF